jgi:hypothetical protein
MSGGGGDEDDDARSSAKDFSGSSAWGTVADRGADMSGKNHPFLSLFALN